MPANDSDLELRSFRIHAPANKALQKILAVLQPGETEPFYAIRSRVKSVKAIRDKTLRKRKDKPDYQPEHITDIVGVRLVSLFREDVIDALKLFLSLIRHQALKHSNSPFVKDVLKEGLIYTNTTVGDPEAITSRLRSVFESFGFPISDDKITQVRTGYSSIHLVAYCDVEYDDEVLRVPIEIQIRTVFEDAWGEIDHKLRYSVNRNRPAPDRVLENWQPHLNVLKTFVDGCSQYAGIIKAQAIDIQERPGAYLIVPVDNPEDALKGIGKSSPKLHAAFKSAYAKRETAMKIASAEAGGAIEKLFMEAADAFSVAGDLISDSTFNSEQEREVAVFLVKMERAFCLLSIGKKQSLDEAISLYSEAQQLSPHSVVVYYRYAQALTKLNEMDAAIAKYERAESLLSSDEYVPHNHWLHTVVPRMLGYALWVKSRTQPKDEDGDKERVRLLVDAFSHNKKACKAAALHNTSSKISQIRNANNALYYAVEYVELTGGGQEITKDDVSEHLQFIERNLDLSTAGKSSLNFIDTLCRASILFDKIEQAVLAAERIEHLLSTPPQKSSRQLLHEDDAEPKAPLPTAGMSYSYYATISHLNDRERDMLDHALWVLRKYGPGPEHKKN